MLEYFFQKDTRLRQLRRGPLGPHIDEFADHLRQAGYAKPSAQSILTQVSKFSFFARIAGVTSAAEINDALVERYLQEELPAEGSFQSAGSAVRKVLAFLERQRGAAPLPSTSGDPIDRILDEYVGHLRSVRGLQVSTCHKYRQTANLLLIWHGERHGDRSLAQMTGADVLEFVSETLGKNDHGGSWRKHLCSSTRGFLRYLGGADLAPSGLERAIPKVPYWRLAQIPRHLPWEKVRALIDSVDTSGPVGKRDKAILLLLATLGLRASEICALQLSHIAWQDGEIRLPATKSRRERVLPLSEEVGSALATYVLQGRPSLAVPQVFLRHLAPQQPFNCSCSVGKIVRTHLHRAGIAAPSRGTHLLRHSLATRLVNVGVPIKTVADVLGHVSINTTAIYTKVDTCRLASVALPFPEGGAE